ncbi:hypothetical protein ACVW0P_003411 [Mucilaginibacter sp. UYNi724]
MDKIAAAFEQFDNHNKTDPNTFDWGGISYPREYFFALKLYEWVIKLEPGADEELLLASRSQHIGRWEIPRESYPEGREAYLKWRSGLAKHHAQIATNILQQLGYNQPEMDRVEQIILKKRIKADADVQTMENALCLVFLEFQYEDFYPKHDDDKVVNILKKTLLKMDAHGHRFALALPYSPHGLSLVKKALVLLN